MLSTGENVAPQAIEDAIQADPLFDQVCVVGNGRPGLAALVVLNPRHWPALARALGTDQGDPNAPAAGTAVHSRIAALLSDLPSSSQVRGIHLLLRPWTIDDGVLTPTLKIKRHAVEERHKHEIDALYARMAQIRRKTRSR